MSDYHSQTGSIPIGREEAALDPGLRKFMLGVYVKMALGLIWSAGLAFAVGTIPQITYAVLTPPVVYIVQWGPVAILLGSNFFMRNASPMASGILYWTVVTLMGLGLGFWVAVAAQATSVSTVGGQTLTVTFATMAKAFLITAGAFGALSLFGYTTKRNLSGLHSMVIMSAWGLFAIGLLSFFFRSEMFELILQAATLVLFSVLVATQTNQLRESYYYLANDQRGQAVMTNFGALNLYIAFVAIFQTLLSFMSRD
ncbi:Bax inhibitor-1/YccA family protein [Terricaulis silvestris]|uniref:Inner membrane protein YbhL n=1 Tax=Terricaulis silvestris TaxID=2686094 RepID=A0A6I6MJF2_9CAUL|nr:Bax inhibitor-1/YccA family protein [Terricaulis silvestris]QGZ95385.1 Inner membrane protein YbhL [Terricaulis silvestris]